MGGMRFPPPPVATGVCQARFPVSSRQLLQKRFKCPGNRGLLRQQDNQVSFTPFARLRPAACNRRSLLHCVASFSGGDNYRRAPKGQRQVERATGLQTRAGAGGRRSPSAVIAWEPRPSKRGREAWKGRGWVQEPQLHRRPFGGALALKRRAQEKHLLATEPVRSCSPKAFAGCATASSSSSSSRASSRVLWGLWRKGAFGGWAGSSTGASRTTRSQTRPGRRRCRPPAPRPLSKGNGGGGSSSSNSPCPSGAPRPAAASARSALLSGTGA